MEHSSSEADKLFVQRFESCQLSPPFSHRDHLRLAYVRLTESDVESSHAAVRLALLRYLEHHGVDPLKYHETLTRAWLMAVRHFMAICPTSGSASWFLAQKPRLLDSRIMLKHYTPGRLFSDEARLTFVEPDLLPIPQYRT